MTIVYEDRDLLVLDKPHGLVVHPAYRHPNGTLWDLLTPLFAAREIEMRPRLLHRLDRDTSGLLCVPKQIAAHRFLERALQAGHFEKGYLAMVDGRPADTGTIDAPLGRAAEDRRRVVVRADGKHARTHYRILRRLPGHALLRVQLETGRTHQIRAHLVHIGHPLAGDPLYNPGSTIVPRLFLHADRLAFPHPDGRRMIRCHSPLPFELRLALCQVG